MQFLSMAIFEHQYFVQGSVATCLRRVGIFYNNFSGNLLMSLSVKEF